MAEDAPPVVNIVGDLVALGPLRRDLIPLYQRWINDFATLRTLGALPPGPTTLEAEEAWYDGLTAGGEFVFTVYQRAGWQPVGTSALRAVDHRHGTAEFGILIGEPAARGHGLGTETARLMLDYAFTALGLRNVLLTCAEYNLAGRRAYEKAGFKEFGRRRQCRALAGRWWDDIYMDCLATEFESPVLERVLAPDEARA
jgi:RimJ/RimL family protein N-acetyltransferase